MLNKCECRREANGEGLGGLVGDKNVVFLFESSWKKPYSTRGVRAMLARYADKAGLDLTPAAGTIRRRSR